MGAAGSVQETDHERAGEPRLKDEFGASPIRVRGEPRGMAHPMFGVLAPTVDQRLRLAGTQTCFSRRWRAKNSGLAGQAGRRGGQSPAHGGAESVLFGAFPPTKVKMKRPYRPGYVSDPSSSGQFLPPVPQERGMTCCMGFRPLLFGAFPPTLPPPTHSNQTTSASFFPHLLLLRLNSFLSSPRLPPPSSSHPLSFLRVRANSRTSFDSFPSIPIFLTPFSSTSYPYSI